MIETFRNKDGFSLVEAMLAVAILAIITTAVFGALYFSQEANALSTNYSKAIYLAEEGIEASKNIRDQDYALLADGFHGVSSSSGFWEFSGSSDNIDGFTREIEIISIDETTKEIVCSVSWQQNPQRLGNVILSTQLVDIYRPEIVDSSSWQTPQIQSSLDLSASHNGNDIVVSGDYAYIVREGGDEFIVVDISDQSSPSVVGIEQIPGNAKSLDISGAYAYVGTSSNSNEFVVVDISNPASPQNVASVNLDWNENVRDVLIDGNFAFVSRDSGRGSEFVSINITDPQNPYVLDTRNFGSTANGFDIYSTYAFVGTAIDNSDIRIVDISDPSNLDVVANYNLPGGADVLSVKVAGEYLFAGRDGGDVVIFDITDPLNLVELSTYDAQDDVREIDIDLAQNLVFLATEESSMEFQVVDVADINAPALYGFLNLSSRLSGIDYVAGFDRAFAVGPHNSTEFIILEPN